MCEVRSAYAHSQNKSLRANQHIRVDGTDIELPNFRKLARDYGDRGRRSNNDSNTRRHQFVGRRHRARGKTKNHLPINLVQSDKVGKQTEIEVKPTEPTAEDFALFGL